MKLDDVRRFVEVPQPFSPESQQRIHEYLISIGIDPSNLYQELEMSSPFVNTHRDVTYSPHPVSLHSHSYIEILYCHNVVGVEYLVGPDRYKLQKGDIVLIPPGISHRPILPEKLSEPYVRDVMWINAEFLASLVDAFPSSAVADQGRPTLLRTAGTKWEYLGDLFRRGVQESERRQPGWEAAVVGNSLQLAVHLFRALQEKSGGKLQAEKPELLDRVLRYIEKNYSRRITLEETARHFYVSQSTISQQFREKMNVSFYRWVTQRRLIAAKSLIGEGVLLEQVGEQVGFSDYSAFYRAFRQEYGISPRQYRKLQEQ